MHFHFLFMLMLLIAGNFIEYTVQNWRLLLWNYNHEAWIQQNELAVKELKHFLNRNSKSTCTLHRWKYNSLTTFVSHSARTLNNFCAMVCMHLSLLSILKWSYQAKYMYIQRTDKCLNKLNFWKLLNTKSWKMVVGLVIDVQDY